MTRAIFRTNPSKWTRSCFYLFFFLIIIIFSGGFLLVTSPVSYNCISLKYIQSKFLAKTSHFCFFQLILFPSCKVAFLQLKKLSFVNMDYCLSLYICSVCGFFFGSHPFFYWCAYHLPNNSCVFDLLHFKKHFCRWFTARYLWGSVGHFTWHCYFSLHRTETFKIW